MTRWAMAGTDELAEAVKSAKSNYERLMQEYYAPLPTTRDGRIVNPAYDKMHDAREEYRHWLALLELRENCPDNWHMSPVYRLACGLLDQNETLNIVHTNPDTMFFDADKLWEDASLIRESMEANERIR